VGKKYGSKGYPQGNAAHMGSISPTYIIRITVTSKLQNNHFSEYGIEWPAITVHNTVCAVTRLRPGRPRKFVRFMAGTRELSVL
jgi:hypothetical protein